MTLINFPDSPTLGQEYTAGSRTWLWTGTTWDAQGTTSGPTGPTGPTGPSGGPTGPIGETGPTGATGADSFVTGPTGATGETGAGFEPVSLTKNSLVPYVGMVTTLLSTDNPLVGAWSVGSHVRMTNDVTPQEFFEGTITEPVVGSIIVNVLVSYMTNSWTMGDAGHDLWTMTLVGERGLEGSGYAPFLALSSVPSTLGQRYFESDPISLVWSVGQRIRAVSTTTTFNDFVEGTILDISVDRATTTVTVDYVNGSWVGNLVEFSLSLAGNRGATGATGPQGTSINFLGSVAGVINLPTGASNNDAYIVDGDGNLYVWDGTSWTDAGQIVGPQGIQGIQGEVGPTGATGDTGPIGPTGAANTLSVGVVTEGAPGTLPLVSVTGTSPNQVLDFTIPAGDTGPANTLTIGTVSATGPDGTPSVTVGGTSPSQTLDFTLQQGPTGPANTLTVGLTTTGLPSTSAIVSITGSAPNQTIDFTVPRGDTGPATVLTVGTTTTGLPGTNALVSVTGSAPAQTLDFTVPRGDTGPANTLTVGTVSQGLPGSSPLVSVTGTAPAQTIDFTIPQGDTGPANTLTIGTVTSGNSDATATATITGTAPSQTLDFILKQGPTGPSNTLTIGTVTTGAPASSALVSITGTSPSQTLDFTIPQGPTGASNTLTVGTVTDGDSNATPLVSITGTSPSQTINFTLKAGPTGPIGETGYVSYADNTARSAELPTPLDGTVAYLQDINALQVYRDTSWTDISIEADSGVITTGMLVQANWTITSQSYRRKNGIVQFRVQAQRTGTDVNVPASGNIGNIGVAQLPSGYRPFLEAPAGGGSVGPIVLAIVDAAGLIQIVSTAPNVPINVGDSISIVGIFLV